MAAEMSTGAGAADSRKVRPAPPPAKAGGSGNSDEDASEDSLALLPRHTKVIVSGNNRTKRALVGQKGVVKKAIGLGGWHLLTLEDGTEIRIQRNALSVLEAPPPTTGDDDSDSTTREEVAGEETGFRTANKDRPESGGERERGRRSTPSVYGAGGVRSGFHLETRRRGAAQNDAGMNVNFHKLESAALKRYRTHYRLEITPGATKDQLVSAVGSHFMSQKVEEKKVIDSFMLSMLTKRLRTQ